MLERDRRIVRRGLLAGAIVWAVVAVVGLTAARGLGGQAAAVLVLLALCVGAAVSSMWLLLALGLDAFAGATIGRRRLLWTAGTVLFTLISPVLVLGAQSA